MPTETAKISDFIVSATPRTPASQSAAKCDCTHIHHAFLTPSHSSP
jgi:hypothetical protein